MRFRVVKDKGAKKWALIIGENDVQIEKWALIIEENDVQIEKRDFATQAAAEKARDAMLAEMRGI